MEYGYGIKANKLPRYDCLAEEHAVIIASKICFEELGVDFYTEITKGEEWIVVENYYLLNLLDKTWKQLGRKRWYRFSNPQQFYDRYIRKRELSKKDASGINYM